MINFKTFLTTATIALSAAFFSPQANADVEVNAENGTIPGTITNVEEIWARDILSHYKYTVEFVALETVPYYLYILSPRQYRLGQIVDVQQVVTFTIDIDYE